jgi:predicted negative regulator of RcsB-dependent stress response
MNFRLKTILALTLFATFTSLLFAAKPFIVKKGGKKEYYDHITADARGVLMLKKGSITKKIKPGTYLYAHIPMPSDLKKAVAALKAKKYSEAAAKLEKLFPKYKLLGWGSLCAYGRAQALEATNQKTAAISALTLLTKTPVDPAERNYYFRAKKLLAKLYADTSSFDKALKILKQLSTSNDSSIVAFANNLNGDILLKQGKNKDAKLMYMRTALLFDQRNKKERPEALVKIIKMLKKEKNNKALEFEKILKADYPGSHYTKEI